MNRRKFLAGLPPGVASVLPKHAPSGKATAQFHRVSTGLEPYTGAWGRAQSAHLLRRTMFGARKQDIDTVAAMTIGTAVDLLLQPGPQPPPPPDYNDANGSTAWSTAAYNSSRDNAFLAFTISWWCDLMLSQAISLREKMTLFWHNHFVSSWTSVKDSRYMYRQNALFRQHALGNCKELTKQVTLDPAMLRYLNGNTNKKGTPNENYARELQELFTIGKGAEIAPGNYTNYTEEDIKAAARVLTGYSDDTGAIKHKFTAANHDSGNKTFSANYGGKVIAGRSNESGAMAELDELLGMIFDQEATALYLCRKLYRWFVYYQIDAATEQNMIVPMAQLLRSNNYDVAPVLRALFSSAHFYDSANVGCMIKNPVDLVIGTLRLFTFPDLNPDKLNFKYFGLRTLRRTMATMQADIMGHPNVAGWPAYWQEPVYHRAWINADTLQKRVKFTNDLATDGYKLDEGYATLLIDPIEITSFVSDPSDVSKLIDESATLLFPNAITPRQHDQIKAVLLPGLPDYEWTVEWEDYQKDPTNDSKKNAVAGKLSAMIKHLLAMAEYQLS
ncbi:MAG: DUF1800 domain-containing protein [Chlorobi bacterium]|nr:MAG: hypothetical protein UZ07_CHB004000930 [Chlorobi bacterium OLB7]MBK8910337.1 DUF1800 domain-containing protein [Chlorobiota bacterium]MBX7217259.1 DUF1800 domain-containing protein [Candidatus Kapabacteria bacterium]